MKILAIMGSPHKGAGYKLVQQFETALKQFGEIDFSYIFLSDVDLKLCKGCFLCIGRGQQYCPLIDDKGKIEEQILAADTIILSSPGYVWNVSALMKNFLDRFAYSLHRPKFFNQNLLLIANGGSGLKGVTKALSLALGGSNIIGKIHIITTPWKPTAKYVAKTNKILNKQAKLLFQVKRPKSISLGNIIWFQIFKKMSLLSKEYIPADFDYFKNKEKYFYEVKVNRVKTIIGKAIAVIAVRSMKDEVDFT